jgi:hypothetical protein
LDCAKKKSGLQRKLSIGTSNDPLEQEADWVANHALVAPTHSAVSGGVFPHIQRFTGQPTGQTDAVPASVDRVLSGSGRPLDPALQLDMGQRFGYDFSRVRVHSDVAAEQSARDVNALAYTVGRNIVFGTGQYAPSTPRGQHLLAHELAHVLQQGALDRPTDLAVDAPGSPLELHADQMVAQVMSGGRLQRSSARSASPGLVLRHATDKAICPSLPYVPISAKSKEVYGPANEAIELAYLNDPRHKNQAVLSGSQFEYGGNKEIRLPKGTSDRKASDAILSRLRGLVKQRAPDIMNFTERTFYEIKTPDFAVSGMVQLESYYALTDVIRQELGEQGGPPWDQGAATWYPPHVLPFPGNPRRLVCTQMTEYSYTTPGLILYIVLELKGDEEKEKKKKKVQDLAKPEQEQEKDKKNAPQQPKAEGEGDDSVLPEVVFGAGGAALTAATIAYLRKRAIEQAKSRAKQLAWRKAGEAAAARRAAEAAGKSVAGKAAAKAASYAEIAAAAALIIFYSDRVEAKPGPGSSAIESLYKAMSTNGTPPSPELKKLIESDPLLTQLAEEAAGSGDGSPLQEEMTRRTLELIRDNPDVFTPKDLEFLMQYSKTAKAAGQSPQTVEQLRKAIDDAKAGKTKAGDSGGGDKSAIPGVTEPAKKEELDPKTKEAPPGKEATDQITQPTRDKLTKAPAPVRDLFKGLLGKGPHANKLTDAQVQRFLSMMPPGLTADQVTKLLENRKPVEGETADQVLDTLQVALVDLNKPAAPKPDAGVPAKPGDKPADMAGPSVAPTPTPASEPNVTMTTGPTVSGSKKTSPEELIKELAAKAKKSSFTDLRPATYRVSWKPEEKGKPTVGSFISGGLRGKLKDGTTYVGRIEAEVTAVTGRNLKIKFVTATPMVSADGKVVLQPDHYVDRTDSVVLDPLKKK